VDSSNLTQAQAKRIHEALYPGLNYIIRLRERMSKRGFPPDDELYRQVCAAYDAVFRLRIKIHTYSCSGAGRKG
jgi:hypothetical protein